MYTLLAVVLPLSLILYTTSPYLSSAWRFVYATFLKPQTDEEKSGSNLQAFLEGKYKEQARIYDETRAVLLPGREAMLGLVAARLQHSMENQSQARRRKPIWVDIGGGTGYNIEAMLKYLPVPEIFDKIYLVDLTPSLLEVARERFARLGWTNVHIICADASRFRLDEYVRQNQNDEAPQTISEGCPPTVGVAHADLVTFSYSLSVMPDFCPVVDMVTSLLSPTGVLGVVDFYVQNNADVAGRNYTAGFHKRHISAMKRTFWRAWFDLDRINLDSARRDYLEYKFGSVFNINCWKYHYRIVPYYIWVGCAKTLTSSFSTEVVESTIHEINRLGAVATASKTLAPNAYNHTTGHSSMTKSRFKAGDVALMNFAFDFPLPSYFYQSRHWRLPFDDSSEKTARFVECTSPFTREEARTDKTTLDINENDMILALTSGGDNILEYAMEHPKQIHALDQNPISNHVLELKVAAFGCLDHSSLVSFFRENDPASFCETLISKLSPHLSSHALQFWMHRAGVHGKRQKAPIARCHAASLEREYFDKLSSPDAFEGMRIHTDGLDGILSQIAPESLTLAIIMDSMDSITHKSDLVNAQISALANVLQTGGRVVLHSSALKPSYVTVFDEIGFQTHRAELPSTVNDISVFKSTWICTKI